ncbi:hypothetical protein NADFUDRAFT_81576 [Nadsonia fulvescens var. elongata DSM 6958]|uniref:Cyclin N-terminal domain-containing protein n=1 Tax=Nadsonia fulvescens var. elongata DSM 6958 TaxID=857566 RepID=A0A1E3PNC8_9ASCO|nr:hypothetical protein NADFUDRAFT_81576 [Nadsonia fulvescens var. elongata DSM 6958]
MTSVYDPTAFIATAVAIPPSSYTQRARSQAQIPPPLSLLDRADRECSRQIEAEYRLDILAHYKKQELTTLPDSSLIDLQSELDWSMRPCLLNFLVEAHLSFRLKAHTLFLAINIADRYCSRRIVYKKHYQLVGCTALWIAAKYEEKKSRVPTVSDLKHICGNNYEEYIFSQMENYILSTLEWKIGHPSMDSFLEIILGTDANPLIKHMAQYFCEVTLFHRAFLHFEPSIVAVCSLALALHILLNYPPISSLKDDTLIYDLSKLKLINSPSHPAHGILDLINQLLQQLDVENTEDLRAQSAKAVQCINLIYQHMQIPSKILQKKYLKSSFSQITQIINNYLIRQQQLLLYAANSPSGSNSPSSLAPRLHHSSNNNSSNGNKNNPNNGSLNNSPASQSHSNNNNNHYHVPHSPPISPSSYANSIISTPRSNTSSFSPMSSQSSLHSSSYGTTPPAVMLTATAKHGVQQPQINQPYLSAVSSVSASAGPRSHSFTSAVGGYSSSPLAQNQYQNQHQNQYQGHGQYKVKPSRG